MKNLTELYNDLVEEINKKIVELLETGSWTTSEFSNKPVLKVEDNELMHNLDGSRWLVELDQLVLIDNKGYEYSHESLTIEQLCEVVDSFKK